MSLRGCVYQFQTANQTQLIEVRSGSPPGRAKDQGDQLKVSLQLCNLATTGGCTCIAMSGNGTGNLFKKILRTNQLDGAAKSKKLYKTGRCFNKPITSS